jgi:hypothetical protein
MQAFHPGVPFQLGDSDGRRKGRGHRAVRKAVISGQMRYNA